MYEQNERADDTGSSHTYKPFSNQTFQQQIYYPPLSGYGPIPHNQQPFSGTAPLSDSRFAAILSYSFGWMTGLLFLLFGGRNRFVRFHALQSLVFFGAINLLDVGVFSVLAIAARYLYILWFVGILFLLMVNFLAFVSWIVVMVQAARGVYFRLPFVGGLVERCFGRKVPPHW